MFIFHKAAHCLGITVIGAIIAGVAFFGAIPAARATQANNALDTAYEMSKRLRACQDIQMSMSRLRCYDDVLGDYNLDTLTLDGLSGDLGKWDIVSEKSNIADTVNVMLSLKSNTPIVTNRNQNLWPTMVIRCREGNIESYLVYHIDIDKQRTVTEPRTAITTRFDRDAPTTVYWDLSGDKQAAFAPDPKTFVETALKYNRLYTQVTPHQRSMIESTFDLRGLNNAIVPLRKVCPTI